MRQRPTNAVKAGKFKSKFEEYIAKVIKKNKQKIRYETDKIPFLKQCTYSPDFKLDNGIYIEVKGRFTASDRGKHLLIKKQHPDVDVRFVFMDARIKLSKKSKTTYAMWCDKKGFKYAVKTIPPEWFNE